MTVSAKVSPNRIRGLVGVGIVNKREIFLNNPTSEELPGMSYDTMINILLASADL
jgi:hypothetical protein